jgi:hypothetical protein
MAHIVKKDYGTHVDTATKLETLLNASTITTFRGCGIVKVGADRYMCWIAYEGT